MKTNSLYPLVDKLYLEHKLPISEYEALISGRDEALMQYAAEKAVELREPIYGKRVFIRGLIEVGNVCRNDCFYCGIRHSNAACERYLLSDEQILECCNTGHALGFRTFVLQGGEGVMPVKRICNITRRIKTEYPDCAVTLSLGEYSFDEYEMMKNSGADRYLLRHETADKEHYKRLHPDNMSFDNRIRCLYDLKRLGFQVGCGFMVGSPFQTPATLAKDLKFVEEFSPDMCGIGPFIPSADTPFKDYKAGSVDETLFLLSIIRLVKPNILLPATTALGTLDPLGREKGMMSGANVVMPNLSPVAVRAKYALYDNKICTGDESAQCKECLSRRMQSVGYEIVTDRGDIKTSE